MNKITVFVTLALLTCGIAAAQQDMGNSSTSGATFTTGTVVSTSRDSLVIRQDSGDQFTTLINGQTVGAMDRAVGTRVKINFHTNTSGQAIADVIQGPGEATAATPPARTEVKSLPAPAPITAPAPQPLKPANIAETKPAPIAPRTVEATAYPSERIAEPKPARTLPKTASNEPTLVLLGLLALAGGLALRTVR